MVLNTIGDSLERVPIDAIVHFPGLGSHLTLMAEVRPRHHSVANPSKVQLHQATAVNIVAERMPVAGGWFVFESTD
jgi:hypothetical protein